MRVLKQLVIVITSLQPESQHLQWLQPFFPPPQQTPFVLLPPQLLNHFAWQPVSSLSLESTLGTSECPRYSLKQQQSQWTMRVHMKKVQSIGGKTKAITSTKEKGE